MTNVCIVATIVVYLAAMLAVGFAYSKSNEDSTDFYLGGRKMPSRYGYGYCKSCCFGALYGYSC